MVSWNISPSVLPHTWLRATLTYNYTIYSIQTITL